MIGRAVCKKLMTKRGQASKEIRRSKAIAWLKEDVSMRNSRMLLCIANTVRPRLAARAYKSEKSQEGGLPGIVGRFQVSRLV